MAKYEFAIKKDVLNSGKVIYTPVCREKSKLGIFGNYLLHRPWQRIVQIYDEFSLLDLHFIPELTYRECELHIKGYQEKLLQTKENEVATVEFHTLEEKEI
jgi:hypothetical protein